MNFKVPFKVYTAGSNLEAHVIVDMLGANGVVAFADEDQSGVSLFAFGRLTQFHQPNVWIEKSDAIRAAELIQKFEEDNRRHTEADYEAPQIRAECEECGNFTFFPTKLKGSTQECSHCGAYMDVGESDWDEDVGEEE